ncbi:putative inner membrane transporter yiJE [Streptomyces sp. YIM 121038]|uniref:DMT family transporter n=1 Tax=Streptomyces sp. YIM 121038 TaxID=2136401 RepID=UPI001110A333|nr:DMT family transporter [Streptomyces sp. YIM 121038]QCX81993.1 putative inner membrane transporter yiJE [Streptomyces sp. YIM 121038]
MKGRGSALLALSTTVLIWASTFVVSDRVLAETGPAQLTFLRFAIGSLVLLPFGIAGGLRARDLFRSSYVVCGLTGVALYYGLQNVGLLFTSPDSAALLQAALPVLTVMLGLLWLRERLRAGRALGLVLAVLGVLLVVGHGGPRFDLLGNMIVLGGVAAYAYYTAYVRRFCTHLKPVVLASASSLWGLVFLTPWLGWEIGEKGFRPPSTDGWLAITYLGVVASGLTLILWTFALRRVPASVAGTFTGGIPAVGYLFAVLTGAPLIWSQLMGGALALAGVILSATSRPDPVPGQPERAVIRQERGRVDAWHRGS